MAGASRRALRIAGALIATPPFLVALVGPASAPALAPTTPVTPALQKVGSQLPLPRHTRIAGLAPAAKLLHVTVTLKPRDPAALAAYAEAVSTPGSGLYRHYLTPAQFGRRFGARESDLGLVTAALRARGLTPGAVSAGGLSIRLTATAARLERGLSISLLKLALPGRGTAFAASSRPSLPAYAAGAVQSVEGLNTAYGPRPLLARPAKAAPGRTKHKRPHLVTGGPQPCSAALAVANSQGAHTADQIASAYGFSGLYESGDQGAGTTVALYELESVDPSDIAAYQSCYGTHTSVSYVRVDGGAGAGPGGGEAALDTENVIGLAPAANVIVYEGPNSNASGPGSGPYDVFSSIINQDRAQVVSVSWGECEQLLGHSDATAESNLFQQAAVQGQTIVAASGDSGSEDCYTGSVPPPEPLTQVQLAVDDPSSQPFVTGVGGTTLRSPGPRPSESVWNTGLLATLLQPGAGGGGISTLWQMPAAQRDAGSNLNILGAGVTGSRCGHPGGYCRQVPDVSADANPATGYVIYWNGSGGADGQTAGWQTIGGTSGAAPLWAALFALTDSSRGCAGHPIGYAIPALYRAASANYATDFNDVRTGNNDFTGTNQNRYSASAGYDEASGLGSPNGKPLADSMCARSLTLSTVRGQAAPQHSNVSLRVRSHDAPGMGVHYRASGLPPGLAIDGTSGHITGRPTHIGRYRVTVTATDAQAATARVAFAWAIGKAPRVLGLSATGLRSRHPLVSFTVKAGQGSPALREIDVALPGGLRFASTRGLSLRTSTGGGARYRARLVSGVLLISLRRALNQASVTLTGPGLRSVSGRRANTRDEPPTRLAVTAVSGAGTNVMRTKLSQGR